MDIERKVCIFCGESIEPGTGKLYIKKDGTQYNFCSNKCKKNMFELGRAPRNTQWTQQYKKDKRTFMKAREKKEEAETTE